MNAVEKISQPVSSSARAVRWPWLALTAALLWIFLARVPLIQNARTHLDSDLAVDGLTLIEATQGHWRWHYPGTPHMGTPPVLLSLPQALLVGATPEALVSGGVAAYGLVVVAVFGLCWRMFGPGVACWSLVPLAFASTGLIWLSGRITGGHLLSVAWYAATLLLLYQTLVKPARGRVVVLGLWAGAGVYLDRMLAPTLLILVLLFWILPAVWPGRTFWQAAMFVLATIVGYLPAVVGSIREPYDAYGQQFESIFLTTREGLGTTLAPRAEVKSLLSQHGKILVFECLPRLFAGHRLPGLQSDPHPAALRGGPVPVEKPDYHPSGILATILGLGLAAGSFLMLAARFEGDQDQAARRCRLIVKLVLGLSSALVIAGFLANRHIYNSDNYRYLVLLVVPWAVGGGLLLDWLSHRGSGGKALAVLSALALAMVMTWDTARWYSRLGWLDDSPRPVAASARDPALTWLEAHPEVDSLFGDYWDTYRLSFLTGARVRGIPYPNYPNRYPEWSDSLRGGRPRTLLARPTGPGPFYQREAVNEGATLLYEAPGFLIYDWPREVDVDGDGSE